MMMTGVAGGVGIGIRFILILFPLLNLYLFWHTIGLHSHEEAET